MAIEECAIHWTNEGLVVQQKHQIGHCCQIVATLLIQSFIIPDQLLLVVGLHQILDIAAESADRYSIPGHIEGIFRHLAASLLHQSTNLAFNAF